MAVCTELYRRGMDAEGIGECFHLTKNSHAQRFGRFFLRARDPKWTHPRALGPEPRLARTWRAPTLKACAHCVRLVVNRQRRLHARSGDGQLKALQRRAACRQ